MLSKLGIHGILPGKTVGLAAEMSAAGKPLATVKAVADPGWLADVKSVSPSTVTLGRFLHGYVGNIDVEGPPIQAWRNNLSELARLILYEELFPLWSRHRDYVDYWEVTNELDPPGVDGHVLYAEFFQHIINIAQQEGYKVSAFSYSMGVPEQSEIDAIINMGIFTALRDGGHSLSLHEYSPVDPWNTFSWLMGRFTWWLNDPVVRQVPIFITEAQVGENLLTISPDRWIQGLEWYDNLLKSYPNVIGAHLFTLGSAGTWKEFDFDHLVPHFKTYLLSQESSERRYERTVHVLPDQPSSDLVQHVSTIVYNDKSTFSYSYDDAGLNHPNLTKRTAILWNIPSEDRASYIEFYARYYPGVILLFKEL